MSARNVARSAADASDHAFLSVSSGDGTFFNPAARWQLIDAHPWLRGTRLSLNVTNIFNARQRVTDATGATPAAFQPAYLDPVGRRALVSFRKQFFPAVSIPAGGFGR